MHSPQPRATRGKILTDAPGRREGLLLGLGLALLACLPFLVAVQPQMTDYPSHLARWHVMLDGGRNPWLARYYTFEWQWSGNLGADMLIWPMAWLFGLEPAGKLIGILIAVLTGLGIVAVEWTLRRRVGAGGLLAFALIWSPAMGMGFYNFCLALALALLSFALWVRLEARPWRWLPFLPIGTVVWLCHIAGWGVLGVLVFGYEWQRRRNLSAFAAPWPLLLPVAFLLTGVATSSMSGNTLVYKWAIIKRTLRDQSMVFDQASLGLLVVLLLAAFVFRRVDGRLGWAAFLLGVLSLLLPRHLGGGDYADYRLMAVAIMVGCIAVDLPGPRWLLWLAPVLFLARLSVTTVAWHESSPRFETRLSALEKIPRGAKVAGAVAIVSGGWAIDPFEHLPSYATVRRDALVNSHFAVPGVHMLRLREGGAGFVDPSHRVFYRPGAPIDLSRFAPAAQADYLWYVGDQLPSRWPSGVEVIYRAPGTILARLAKAHGAR